MNDSLAAVVNLVRQRGGSAQLVVLRDGEVLLDHSQGHGPDHLFWSWSVSKPYLSILVHQLAADGILDIDAAVSYYWPEFARHGKGAITLRQVLHHRAGFSTSRGLLGDALAMTNWRRSIRNIENARLKTAPGAVPSYQVFTYGHILGEVIQRVTGEPLKRVMTETLLEPLGATNTMLGVGESDLSRCVPIRSTVPLATAALNSRAVRTAVIPSAGMSTTARDAARFYEMLLNGGRNRTGTQVISPEILSQATAASSTVADVDGFARTPILWAHGFQLGGRTPSPFPPLGSVVSPRAFGHNGSNVCVAWADPDRRLVVAYLTNLVASNGARHMAAVSNAVAARVRAGRPSY
ncbi:beta-lactamase family protein [Rathayibacter caricis]|uniref:serine hydrolase domain-containing protein n=1 Tax=Rathayibacter caricis TaxID=110936 RepID=UPI001FB2BABB|nr:serine hydrolase domain-containing protein [Rathayibacter caricis]MCJ1697710.1 beta-lactamase family protein [Rathayibacter caricis]